MNPLPKLKYSTANWRQTLQQNNRRTFIVISLFFLIYFSIGMLIDVYIYSGHMRDVPLSNVFMALITFKLFPLVTLIMVGIAAISLLITFALHDRIMLLGTEYHEVTAESKNYEEKQLYNIVEELKIAAGLSFMPKVYIIEANYMNAFASGYSEKSAMLAITRGLMEKLDRSELQAVMAHELSHIRHMDIKLTLMASVLANLMVMVLDIFFYSFIFSGRNREESKDRATLGTIIIIIRYLLPVINILLLMYLSRTREYMADAGSVELLRDNQPLVKALLKISDDHKENQDEYHAAYQQTPHENVRREAYIFDPIQAGIESTTSVADLFSTHPNLKDRLAALGIKYEP